MKEEKLSADLEKRLFDLEEAIRSYRETGNIDSLFPRLYFCCVGMLASISVVESKK